MGENYTVSMGKTIMSSFDRCVVQATSCRGAQLSVDLRNRVAIAKCSESALVILHQCRSSEMNRSSFCSQIIPGVERKSLRGTVFGSCVEWSNYSYSTSSREGTNGVNFFCRGSKKCRSSFTFWEEVYFYFVPSLDLSSAVFRLTRRPGVLYLSTSIL